MIDLGRGAKLVSSRTAKDREAGLVAARKHCQRYLDAYAFVMVRGVKRLLSVDYLQPHDGAIWHRHSDPLGTTAEYE
jgi:hypothetical protein